MSMSQAFFFASFGFLIGVIVYNVMFDTYSRGYEPKRNSIFYAPPCYEDAVKVNGTCLVLADLVGNE